MNFLRGMAMGLADLVPGVSGGTIALVLGIYQRFINALASLGFDLLLPKNWNRAAWQERDLGFLVVLGLGIVTSILAGAKGMHALLANWPAFMAAMFAGLILGSLNVPGQLVRRDRQGVALVLLGAGLAWLAGGQSSGTAFGTWFVPLAAAIAICAMMLPGISGSALLLLMGMYAPTIAAVEETNLVYLALFAAGAGVGLLLFSRVIRRLMQRAPGETMSVLLGMMIGSLRRLWPWRSDGFGEGIAYLPTGGEWIIGALGFAAGLLLALLAQRISPAGQKV